MNNSPCSFSVKFRGIRGSYPTPEKSFLEFGGNTSCVEVNAGGHLIILDAGTGIISLGNELMKSILPHLMKCFSVRRLMQLYY